jgi:Flp pilus assembly protein TadG
VIAALRALRRSCSGVAMTEFAMGAPFLLVAGLWGTEMANYALVNMKIGQLAVHIADNASRIGDTSMLQDRKIYEADINDVIYDNGRVIISSLEVKASAAGGAGQQYIHWQRCRGKKMSTSSYGKQGDVLTAGMGPAGQEVLAMDGDAVIFVQISYTYQPLISAQFMGSLDMHSIAAFNVRDDRDLSQIYQREPGNPDAVQGCSAFTGTPSISPTGKMT